jgi:hypothetical protein
MVADRRVSECMDPEENMVNSGWGAGEGPGPSNKEQDKQLICISGGDETPMGEPGGQQDEYDTASRIHQAQSKSYCDEWPLFCKYIVAISNVNTV